MVVCTPCLASVLGPAALGSVGLATVNKLSKKRKKTKKGKKGGMKRTRKKSKKGGSGYETQAEYDEMMNQGLYRESSYDRKERENNERKEIDREMYILDIRKQEMRKECSNLVRLLEKKGVSKEKAKEYANQMVNHKIYCDNGDINSCNYCQEEYLKNLTGVKGSLMTPRVPVEALPRSRSKKSKSKSKSKSKKGGARSSSKSKSKSKSKKRTPLRGRLRMYQVPKPGETPEDNEIRDLETSLKLLEKDRRFRDIFDTFAYAEGIPVETDEKRMEQYKGWIETGKNPPSHMDRYDYSTRSIDPSSKNWASKNWVSQLRKSNRPLNVQQRQILLWTLNDYKTALENEQK